MMASQDSPSGSGKLRKSTMAERIARFRKAPPKPRADRHVSNLAEEQKATLCAAHVLICVCKTKACRFDTETMVKISQTQCIAFSGIRRLLMGKQSSGGREALRRATPSLPTSSLLCWTRGPNPRP